MLAEKASFGRYGKTFQEGLVQLIFEDRPFADQITEVLDGNFLELEYLRVFLRKILEYRAKYNRHPSVEAMTSILRTELESENETSRTQVREYFVKIHSRELTDPEYIKETSLDFCRKQNLKEAMLKSIPLLQKNSFDEISTVINEALKLGSENNFGYDYIADFEKRFEPKYRRPVSTGWADMDSITGGGLGKSELGVVIAPTGAGKSMILVHLGSEGIKEGKTVIHYTLELQDTVIATRYDSCITGYPLSDIINFKDEVMMRFNDVIYALPALPFLIILAVTISNSIFLMIGFLMIFSWVGIAKVSRSMSLQIKTRQYIEAAKIMGQKDSKIIFRHILPQLLPYAFASIAISVPAAITTEAGLSFLGLGDPSFPTWGQILHDANTYGAAAQGFWWWIIPPGILIAITGLAFVFIGNALDAIVNPKLKR